LKKERPNECGTAHWGFAAQSDVLLSNNQIKPLPGSVCQGFTKSDPCRRFAKGSFDAVSQRVGSLLAKWGSTHSRHAEKSSAVSKPMEITARGIVVCVSGEESIHWVGARLAA